MKMTQITKQKQTAIKKKVDDLFKEGEDGFTTEVHFKNLFDFFDSGVLAKLTKKEKQFAKHYFKSKLNWKEYTQNKTTESKQKEVLGFKKYITEEL